LAGDCGAERTKAKAESPARTIGRTKDLWLNMVIKDWMCGIEE